MDDLRATKDKSRRIVLTYGTFDLFHVGHLNLLNRLKELGNYLIVGVSTDDFNRSKGKTTVIPFADRSKIVSAIRAVDMVIPEYSWDQKIEDIRNYEVDVFGMGSDWESKFDFLKSYCEVVYLPRTDGVSSTAVKKALTHVNLDQVDKLREAVKMASEIIDKLA